jgi:NAD-dependent deacetylase
MATNPVPDAVPPIPAALIGRSRRACAVTLLTGAGISAQSGLPTFRDAQTGTWAKCDPLELATPDAFRRNAKLVWDRQGEAKPNPGHRALAALEAVVPGLLVITQNVDGLHQAAGRTRVVELAACASLVPSCGQVAELGFGVARRARAPTQTTSVIL